MKLVQWILSWFGGGPLKTVADALNKAYGDKLNATTEHDKVAADERIRTLEAALADVADARAGAANLPGELRLLMFMIGFPFALHVFLIGAGTNFQPMIADTFLGTWLLNVPPMPAPFDSTEAQVIGFFYGAVAVIGTGRAIAGAIARRK